MLNGIKTTAKLCRIPYDVICVLKEYCGENEAGQLITEDVLSFCMKATELAVRRKRIPDQGTVWDIRRETMIPFIPVFNENNLASKSFIFRKLTKEELKHPAEIASTAGRYSTPQEGIRCVVKSLQHFQRNLEAFTKLNGLSNILNSNVLIMGGCVLACLQRQPSEIEKMHEHLDL